MFLWIRYESFFPVYPEWFIFFLFSVCRPIENYCGQETLTDLYYLVGSTINVSIMVLVIYAIYHLITSKRKSS